MPIPDLRREGLCAEQCEGPCAEQREALWTEGPCADKRVICRIEAKDGSVIYGENRCENAQSICPRVPGEGYEKCASVCHQKGHAEVVAIGIARSLGIDLKGARAYVSGISWICNHCRQATTAAGIERIYIETQEK